MAAADASTEVSAAETDAAAPALLWDRANTAYINGDYRAAAETYEELLAQGLVSRPLRRGRPVSVRMRSPQRRASV